MSLAESELSQSPPQTGYVVEVENEDRLRAEAQVIRLRKYAVSWALTIVPALIIGLHDIIFHCMRMLPVNAIAPTYRMYIVYLLLVALMWISVPLLYFEYLWHNRLDLGTRSNDTYNRTSALQRVVDIYAESQKYSVRALLFGIVGIIFSYETLVTDRAVGWQCAVMAVLTLGLLALALAYQMRRIGPYLIDNILFVCIRSEQSTMSHQEAIDQLRIQGSPRFRKGPSRSLLLARSSGVPVQHLNRIGKPANLFDFRRG